MIPDELSAPSDLGRFRGAVARRLGLSLEGRPAGELETTLRRRAEAAGGPASAYLERLESSDPWPAETASLADELTVGETYFFRNAAQFQALVRAVLPARARATGTAEPICLLSAGCSTGEEAYSLAIAARETPELAGRALVVRGVDVNPSALARAAAARYTPWALRETSPETRARYFRPSGRDYLLAPEVRAAVVFEQRNLAADHPAAWAELGRFDVIFCRNLLMYLTREAARTLVGRLARALVPGGYLFLGHAETLRGLSDELELEHTHDTFYYRRGGQLPTAEHDEGWVDDISRATARIRALTATETPPPSPGEPGGDAPAALDPVVGMLGDERLADARAALERLPPAIADSPRGLLIRAVLASHGDDLAAAERLCERLLEMSDRDAGAWFLKALCAQRSGDLRAALEGHRRAAALDPSFAMPRLHLGLLARRAHDGPAARRELKCALPLLESEDRGRLSLFGGGFGRAALLALCRAELAGCGGVP